MFYPATSKARDPIWSAPLTSDNVSRILRSPSRITLVKEILRGDVAVWVFVPSGHRAKDERALTTLRASLKRASETLRIPEVGTDANGDPIVVEDFKTYPVHFDLVEIGRQDGGEEVFLHSLLKSEPDLELYQEPLAFPVFGRGRALYALVGDGIQEATVLEACQSLINWCSCEIKASNPGTDLLISADWSRPHGGHLVKDPEVPLTGVSGFVPSPAAGSTQTADPAKSSPAVCPARPADAKAAESAADQRSRMEFLDLVRKREQ